VTDLTAYDIPFNEVEQQVLSWVKESLELRHGAAGDPKGTIKGAPQETTDEITDLLLRVRVRSDRVDELLSKVTLARGRARRAKEEAAFTADKVLMEATQHHASKRVEFSSGREREAEAKLDAFEERRLAHQGDRLVSVTNDCYEVINQVHWQLDAIRKDLRAQLHALQFESSLER
jgi:hypothetical protein